MKYFLNTTFMLLSIMFIGCKQDVRIDNQINDTNIFGVVNTKTLDSSLWEQLNSLNASSNGRISNLNSALVYEIKNPDESIVEGIGIENIKDNSMSFYPVVDGEILDFTIIGKSVEKNRTVIQSYYYDNTLLYDVTIEKSTGIVLAYSVNDSAFDSTSGRVNGDCGFLCRGGNCLKTVLEFMGNGSAEGTAAAIGCGVVIEACAAGVGLGCGVVAFFEWE